MISTPDIINPDTLTSGQETEKHLTYNLIGVLGIKVKVDWVTHLPWEYCCLGGWQKLHLRTPAASFVESLLDLRHRGMCGGLR